jgi:hypothetical protein
MREELDKALCEKYPKIFRDRHGDMMTTAMCWGFPGDGWYNILDRLCSNIQWHIDQVIERNERNREYLEMVAAARAGDFSLFDQHFHYVKDMPKALEKYRKEVLEEVIPEWRQPDPEIPQVVATQVKEKFGTLRFYYEGGDDYIQGLVDMAESMSAVTCEECGVPGKQRGGGWILTSCDKHAEENKNHLGALTAVDVNDIA